MGPEVLDSLSFFSLCSLCIGIGYAHNKVGLLGMIVWIDKILLGVLSLELLWLCWHMPLHEKMVDL